jgi:hypothetical protein
MNSSHVQRMPQHKGKRFPTAYLWADFCLPARIWSGPKDAVAHGYNYFRNSRNAGHVSFERAAALAGLNLEAFHHRLQEHFGHGFALVDEVVRGDIQTARELSGMQ